MTRPPNPVLWIPPPVFYVATFIVGLLLQKLTPWSGLTFPSGARWVGLGLIVLGVLCAFGSALLFLVQRTTLIPHETPSRLVVRGAYRFTRNPMYLGLGLVYLGVALRLGGLLPLFLLPVPLLLMDRIVIPVEEAALRRTRGTEYDAYCARVRRWL